MYPASNLHSPKHSLLIVANLPAVRRRRPAPRHNPTPHQPTTTTLRISTTAFPFLFLILQILKPNPYDIARIETRVA